MPQVKLGPNFFKKIKNDYSNWQFAWVRELLQNSIDAPGCSNIDIRISEDSNHTVGYVTNDGAPMDENTLVGKLLALGESGKNFQDGSIGGFGIAKSLIYLCHEGGYVIRTGDLIVHGLGGDYVLSQSDKHLHGTESTVRMAPGEGKKLLDYCRAFVYMTQWPGNFTINGEELQGRFRKGSRRREFTWGTVYTNKSIANRLIVRIHGVPMFTRHLDCNDRTIVLELKGNGADVLQSNRDSLKWQYQNELDAFCDEVTVNKHSALRDTSPAYYHYKGDKLHGTAQQKISEIIQEAYATIQEEAPPSSEETPTEAPEGVETTDYRAHTSDVRAPEQHLEVKTTKSQISSDFVLKNCTGMEVPDYYLPTAFSSYSSKLAGIWAKCLLKLHEVAGKTGSFSIGFILDEDREAEMEQGDYGLVYYINPAVVVRQTASASRSLKKRFKFTPAGRWQILALAAHEFTHGALAQHSHDEAYASALTDLSSIVLRHRDKFNSCF